MFFFYDIGTIQDSDLPTVSPTKDFIHAVPYKPWVPITPTEYNNYSLKELLESWERKEWSSYQQAYERICESQTLQCSKIQLQFSLPSSQEYYYALVTLLTIQELNTHLITTNSINHTIILKNENNKKRWYTSQNSVVVNIHNLSESEFFEVLVHELWHIIDLAIIVWWDKQKNNNYTEFQKAVFSIDDPSLTYYAVSRESEWVKKQGSKKEDFCTVYGSSNPFEDFSECFNLYINHHDYFVSLAQNNTLLQKKYNLISTWIRNPRNAYLPQTYRYSTEPSHRERDSTKIPVSEIEVTEI